MTELSSVQVAVALENLWGAETECLRSLGRVEGGETGLLSECHFLVLKTLVRRLHMSAAQPGEKRGLWGLLSINSCQ